MIKAMDILLVSERIVDGQNSGGLSDSDYTTVGALVTADISGSGNTVYKVIEITGQDSVKIQSQKTKIIYNVPREFLSPVLINNPVDNVDIKVFKNTEKDSLDIEKNDSDSTNTINQIGVKTPGESLSKNSKKNGIYLLHGQPQFAKTRFDRRS